MLLLRGRLLYPEATVGSGFMSADKGVQIEVLYIEDSPSYAKLVEHVFASRPHIRLVVSEYGLPGFELARRSPPSLIMLDRHLPDVTGDEVLARLRSAPETAGVPVVMVTSDDTPADIERLLAAGASAWLVKPFQPSTLLEIVEGETTVRPPLSSRGAVAEAGAGPGRGEWVDETVLANLRRLTGASPNLDLASLLTVFRREGRSRIDQLRLAVDAGDATVIADVAHSLIGSSSSFGARMVAQRSRHLQRLALAGDLTDAAAEFARLESDFTRTSAALAEVSA